MAGTLAATLAHKVTLGTKTQEAKVPDTSVPQHHLWTAFSWNCTWKKINS